MPQSQSPRPWNRPSASSPRVSGQLAKSLSDPVLHVEAVSWLDVSAFAAVPEDAAALARCPERDRLCTVELGIVPVHLAQRMDLAREEPLGLFGAFRANPHGYGSNES